MEEIRAAGGEAVANADSVAETASAKRIVETAVTAFGRVDGIVNNAGILRDRIFHRMSVVDFELVIQVHLMGSFYMSHAAAPYFKERGSRSFVAFTSTSGLVGNFGQANYAAAKMGIVGLSKSIALDMNQRYDGHVAVALFNRSSAAWAAFAAPDASLEAHDCPPLLH